MIKASFVMPVKNGEKFIVKTIKSILNQTIKNIELIVVDDHSQDKTAIIVKKMASDDSQLIFFSNPGKGVAAARNAGTNKARGKIILPVDADDPNYPERTAISIEELEKNQTDIFYGNLMRSYSETGKKKLRHFQPYDHQLLRYINFIAHAGSSAYYKYVWEKVGGYDEGIEIGEDYDFWLKAQETGFKFSCKNIPLAQYTMHGSQTTGIENNPEKIKKRQYWNQIIRRKHRIYKIDENYVRKTAAPAVIKFYLEQNYPIWFGKESIPFPRPRPLIGRRSRLRIG